jgi:2,3-dihydroxybenzoate decarboxylase
MRGVLLNNIQIAGANRDTVMFYDEPRFDEFWATAEKLDAPVYIHPGFIPAAGGRLLDYEGFEFLTDASWGYAVSTGLHALRIITSGVFDRHPRAQLVLGHLGEHIVLDMWRINNRIKRRPLNCVMKKELRSYFSTNVHVTTSGQFGNLALQHAIGEIGADRIMFAVDYPYEENAEGTSWFARAPISEKDRQAIGRDNAIRVFHLPLKP